MLTTLGAILIIGGLALALFSQVLIGLHAFTGNPAQGILCFVVPFYVYLYAKRHSAGRVLMRAWYAGVAALIVGTVLGSS